MKKYKALICAAFVGVLASLPASAAESHVMEFNIIGGGSHLSASAKRTMEQNLVNLLTMMSDAQARGSKSLDFSGISITPSAKSAILVLWKHQPLKIWTDEEGDVPFIEENLLNMASMGSYQIRNIPVRLFPTETPGKDKYSEVSLTFSTNGTISDFNITMERQQFDMLTKNAVNVQDYENRVMLAHWMDQLKTAYERKDLDYLMSLFDEGAVIITGVSTSVKSDVRPVFNNQETFDYYVKNKQQYRNSMRQVFRNNKVINVNFTDQKYGCNDMITTIAPNGEEMPRYYMVWCTQEWNATRYSDVGKLFVLWDFKDPEKPLIMVRAWTKPSDQKQFSDADFQLPTN